MFNPVYYSLSIFFLLQALSNPLTQSPLGKSQEQIIDQRGTNFKKMADNGHLVFHFQKNETGKYGNYTVSEFLYFEHDTCYKDVTLLPGNLMKTYVDSFNNKYKSTGANAWKTPDGTFISASLRDGALDVTYFSADYYKSMSGK